jgi:hypothetical protein
MIKRKKVKKVEVDLVMHWLCIGLRMCNIIYMQYTISQHIHINRTYCTVYCTVTKYQSVKHSEKKMQHIIMIYIFMLSWCYHVINLIFLCYRNIIISAWQNYSSGNITFCTFSMKTFHTEEISTKLYYTTSSWLIIIYNYLFEISFLTVCVCSRYV